MRGFIFGISFFVCKLQKYIELTNTQYKKIVSYLFNWIYNSLEF